MIQRSIATWQDLSWQEELELLVKTPKQLLDLLELGDDLLPAAERAHAVFPLRVTRSFIARMEKGNSNDPLLRQVLPLHEELDNTASYSNDPLNEIHFNATKGIVHKYHGRVLIVAASHCAINCRYCFRRTFDYSGNRMNKMDWQHVFDYVRTHDELSEVILSGGDPLGLPDSTLQWLITQLDDIPHIERIRVHTRFPIVLPKRVSENLVRIFTSSRLQPVWVIHCNHPQEIDSEVSKAMHSAATAGITLLNQSVLLRGVNDAAPTLVELSNKLFRNRVLPYYLHLLDRVTGAQHFDLPEAEVKKIYAKAQASLSGYLLPKLVKEVPGEPAKRIVA